MTHRRFPRFGDLMLGVRLYFDLPDSVEPR
jgi:hypothetical protein